MPRAEACMDAAVAVPGVLGIPSDIAGSFRKMS